MSLRQKTEYFQKIIESLHFNKVLSNHIFLESTLAREIMVKFSLPWQPRNHAFDANLLEIEGSQVEKLVQKLIFHFFLNLAQLLNKKNLF